MVSPERNEPPIDYSDEWTDEDLSDFSNESLRRLDELDPYDWSDEKQEADGMWLFENETVPSIRTALPGPKAQALLQRDEQVMSPSYTRIYPLVCARGSGAVIEDVDGNRFLDFTAGIAVTATGHCHPHVVAAIQDQAA